MGVLGKIRLVVWGAPADTQEERRLIVKLDWFILSFCCLMYWVNYLDRANITNAYVSGMKEDLNMHGTQFNQINTIFYGGYVLGQIPQNLALQKLPPRLWFPAMTLCWGLLTLGTGFVSSAEQIMVIRFFQGLCEASTFVGCQYVLGSWYKNEELGKRTAIFTSSGLAGSMFSGFLQGGIYGNLNGKNGLAGWQWLFVIDFLITIPIAIYGFLMFPDTPTTTKAFYLSESERALAISRIPEVSKQRGVLGLSLITRVLRSWQFWGFVIIWIFSSNTEMWGSNGILALYLTSLGTFSVERVDYIPTAIPGIGIVVTLICGWYGDYYKDRRWHMGIFIACTAVISGGVMVAGESVSEGAKIFALMLGGCQYAGQTVFFMWANDLCRKDDAMRSMVIASMNCLATAFYMWWSIVFYNADQAPDWFAGSVVMIIMGACVFVNNGVIRWFELRDQRAERLVRDLEESTGMAEKQVATEEVKALDA